MNRKTTTTCLYLRHAISQRATLFQQTYQACTPSSCIQPAQATQIHVFGFVRAT
jgi:hypothetical protein